MRQVRHALLMLFVAANFLSTAQAQDPTGPELDEAESRAFELLIETVELIRNDPVTASLVAADRWCMDFVLLRHPPG